MGQLFQRAWKLQVGPLDLSRLAFQFRVKSSLKPEPNTCDLSIYNLNNDHRQQLELLQKPVVRLEVGYQDRTHQIFLGEVRTGFTEVDGPERITKFSSGDGEQLMQGTRIRVTYGAQIQIDTAIQEIAKAMNVGTGNLSAAAANLKNKGIASIYPQGVSLSGNAWQELKNICKSCGLEVSVQDGALLLLEVGQALAGSAVRLAPDSGLEGSPTADNDGTVNAVSKIIPELRPGVKVQLESLSVGRGIYRVYDAEYTGDTHGQDWNVALGLQKVKNASVQLQELVI